MPTKPKEEGAETPPKAAKKAKRTGRGTGRRTTQAVSERTGTEARGTLFDNMADDTYLVVWRRDDNMQWVLQQFRLDPQSASEEVIAEKRGGGTYMIREKVRNERGQMVFSRQRTIHIDGPGKTYVPPSSETNGDSKGAVTVAPGGVGMDEVMTAGLMQVFKGMQAASEMQSAAIARIMERPDRPAIPWELIVPLLVPVLEKMLSRDALGDVEKLANVLAAQQKGASGLGETIESIMAIFELKDQLAGGSGDPIMDFANKNMPGIIEIVKQGLAQGQTPQQIQQSVHQAASGTGAPANPNPDQPMWQLLLSQWGPRLIDYAKRDVDPEASAKVLMGYIPDQFRGALREFLEKPDAESILFQTVPGLREYQRWTEDFFNGIVLEFDPDAFDDVDDGPPGELPTETQVGEFVSDGEEVEFASIPETPTEEVEDERPNAGPE